MESLGNIHGKGRAAVPHHAALLSKTRPSTETEVRRPQEVNLTFHEFDNDLNIIDIVVWENEGGTLHDFSMHHNYGRRVERNGYWKVYHVYTGLPAEMGKHATTGLNETTATSMMLSLNAQERAPLSSDAERTTWQGRFIHTVARICMCWQKTSACTVVTPPSMA
ncbi:MAG: hypothetical protein AAAB35_13695 [Phyllobacterium sp.]|uniref:hypothetical protein n=1 Tax=Phyllobacterium sp. TaxID=1871046 RepID=UPI0030F0EF51